MTSLIAIPLNPLLSIAMSGYTTRHLFTLTIALFILGNIWFITQGKSADTILRCRRKAKETPYSVELAVNNASKMIRFMSDHQQSQDSEHGKKIVIRKL